MPDSFLLKTNSPSAFGANRCVLYMSLCCLRRTINENEASDLDYLVHDRDSINILLSIYSIGNVLYLCFHREGNSPPALGIGQLCTEDLEPEEEGCNEGEENECKAGCRINGVDYDIGEYIESESTPCGTKW